jgi:CDP-2,3-bis-(O-geranylgeranyl)-sn-glycerol synthase
MTNLDPTACALFLLCAFTIAGAAQIAWFRSARSRPFMAPLDGGCRLRGRRIFGDNKTIRGFVVMVPAAAAAFTILALLVDRHDPSRVGLWPLSLLQYAALGGFAGFGFMAGELPNSFVKRQLGIPDGQALQRPAARAVQFVVDRLDSGIGMLGAASLMVPVPVWTWACVLLVGPFIHWCFSLLMFRLGIKARAA